MTWTDAEDIGIALFEKFKETDPLTVRFTDLLGISRGAGTAAVTVLALAGFAVASRVERSRA